MILPGTMTDMNDDTFIKLYYWVPIEYFRLWGTSPQRPLTDRFRPGKWYRHWKFALPTHK